MAECTPNFRASYDAAETTPRSSRCPPTTTAFPFSDGSDSSSTDTKKASMSTWKIVFVRRASIANPGRRARLQILGDGRRSFRGRTQRNVGARHQLRLPGAFVDFHVLLRRSGPGKIAAHTVAHQHMPRSLIAKGLQRGFDGKEQGLTTVLVKLETGSLPGAGVPGFDGVIEPAGGAHDGHGSVFQTVNLVQTARLVARGHQEHVSARLDLVRDHIVVRDLDRDLLRKLL